MTDIVAITKGYGWQGVIQRFGGRRNPTRTPRSADNMVTWAHSVMATSARPSIGVVKPATTSPEYNKRILRVANPEDHSITPAGGFLHYGEIKSDYILVKGSVPGPARNDSLP